MAEQDEVASKVLRRAQVSKVALTVSTSSASLLTLCAVDDQDAAEQARTGQRQDQERLGVAQHRCH